MNDTEIDDLCRVFENLEVGDCVALPDTTDTETLLAIGRFVERQKRKWNPCKNCAKKMHATWCPAMPVPGKRIAVGGNKKTPQRGDQVELFGQDGKLSTKPASSSCSTSGSTSSEKQKENNKYLYHPNPQQCIARPRFCSTSSVDRESMTRSYAFEIPDSQMIRCMLPECEFEADTREAVLEHMRSCICRRSPSSLTTRAASSTSSKDAETKFWAPYSFLREKRMRHERRAELEDLRRCCSPVSRGFATIVGHSAREQTSKTFFLIYGAEQEQDAKKIPTLSSEVDTNGGVAETTARNHRPEDLFTTRRVPQSRDGEARSEVQHGKDEVLEKVQVVEQSRRGDQDRETCGQEEYVCLLPGCCKVFASREEVLSHMAQDEHLTSPGRALPGLAKGHLEVFFRF
ncbi:unnamed protein product [Amoebophrya sp. A25]|nr:unnamed protein product [Amoebophrya sp. A25]|eukprot:GSA25T00015453001.1